MELQSGTGPLDGCKGTLKKSIGKICLTEKKLETFLAEVEAVIYSRPLV